MTPITAAGGTAESSEAGSSAKGVEEAFEAVPGGVSGGAGDEGGGSVGGVGGGGVAGGGGTAGGVGGDAGGGGSGMAYHGNSPGREFDS